MSVFVDTSALYALLVDGDQFHEQAHQTFDSLLAGEVLITHNYVAVETVSLVHTRFGRATVGHVRDLLELLEFVWVEDDAHQAALDQLLVGPARRGPSFVDLVSFEVMRRLDIKMAFAYDDDFVAHGFALASPSEP